MTDLTYILMQDGSARGLRHFLGPRVQWTASLHQVSMFYCDFYQGNLGFLHQSFMGAMIEESIRDSQTWHWGIQREPHEEIRDVMNMNVDMNITDDVVDLVERSLVVGPVASEEVKERFMVRWPPPPAPHAGPQFCVSLIQSALCRTAALPLDEAASRLRQWIWPQHGHRHAAPRLVSLMSFCWNMSLAHRGHSSVHYEESTYGV
ncbi:unnamed protein product [Prorocentrum cordatum]|uniref:Uncharacterized protein n=1 Tax=Prorocentrum cordatum TaxID=2364126 RepID=A0ABN9PMS7_9DINO|nr:unnamed protein product [Polarella glacialis]